jgi:hypothetical protein
MRSVSTRFTASAPVKTRQGWAPGTHHKRWIVLPVNGCGARVWLLPGSRAEQDRDRLICLFRQEVDRIVEALEIKDRSKATVDFYLHEQGGSVIWPKDIPLAPGCGFAGVIPILHRPYTQMVYAEEWNLDRQPEAMPCFRDVAANETVKAYLLLMLPRLAVFGNKQIGWIEEGMAAYLQGSTFDGHDVDVWARAALECGAARSIVELLQCDFSLLDWSDADRAVFDLVLIRQLGSFWRYWNRLHGMNTFRLFYRARYRLAFPRLTRWREQFADLFKTTYGVCISAAQAQWQAVLETQPLYVPTEVAMLMQRATTALPTCRWRGIPL